MGSTNNLTPFELKILSASPSPGPSSIISPYWNPEHPPPCTNTRKPASFLCSSESKAPIFPAAASVTVTGPLLTLIVSGT